jgi:hypothetical protein
MPPAASTFSASGSRQPSKPSDMKSVPNLLPGENLSNKSSSAAERARKLGIKVLPKNKDEKIKDEARKTTPPSIASASKEQEQQRIVGEKSEGRPPSIKKATVSSDKPSSPSSKHEESNVAAYPKPSVRKSSKTSSPIERPRTPSPQADQSEASNQHFNDTIFGDEPPRTMSPNDELDSLNKVYQDNVNVEENEENENANSVEIEEEIADEEIKKDANNKEDEDEDEDEEEYDASHFEKYNATSKIEEDVVIGAKGSWDPNDTSKLPKNGDENNVIVEISHFTLNENSDALKRDNVQKLFVAMNFSFIEFDYKELEANSSMPKPSANQPVYFNFRKSRIY